MKIIKKNKKMSVTESNILCFGMISLPMDILMIIDGVEVLKFIAILTVFITVFVEFYTIEV